MGMLDGVCTAQLGQSMRQKNGVRHGNPKINCQYTPIFFAKCVALGKPGEGES